MFSYIYSLFATTPNKPQQNILIKKELKQSEKIDTDWEIPLLKDIVKKNFFPYLEPKEADMLSAASAPFKKYCESEFKLIKFLECVSQGNQDGAEKLIKENTKLLLEKGNFTDLSGRVFYQTTAFQYAIWALDYHMWTMLLRYLLSTYAKQAQEQLTEVLTDGIEYKLSESNKWKRENHYDFSALINCLSEYKKNYRTNWNLTEEMAWYEKMANAQRNVPAHIAHKYCRRDRSFYPTPLFNEETLPRTCEFHDTVIGRSYWFTSHKLKEGFIFITRGDRPISFGSNPKMRVSSPMIDLNAMIALRERRLGNLALLKKQLSNQEETAAFKF